MVKMFEKCINLKSLDLSGFKTLRVENFDSMFNGLHISYLLDLTNFNLVKAIRLDSMLSNCQSLINLDISTSINLSHFNTGRVYSFIDMFESFTSLEKINLNNLDISQERYMRNIFRNCHKLSYIDFIVFKSGNNLLFGIDSMFNNCTSLSMINLSKLNLTQFESDYPDFYSGDLFIGVKSNGELIYTEVLIPTKIKNAFPSRLEYYYIYV